MQNISTKKRKQISSNQIFETNQKKQVSPTSTRIPPNMSNHGKTITTPKGAPRKNGQTDLVKNVVTRKQSSVMSQGLKPSPNTIDVGSRLSEIIDTGISIGKTVTGLVAGDPTSLTQIPNTLLKVVDTAKNVIRDINKSDATQKVIAQPGIDLKESGNQIILDKLKDVQPVLTVTQLPSSNGIEVSLPTLRSVVAKTPDNQGFYTETVYGSFAGANVVSSPTFVGYWAQNGRVLPRDINRFGTRVANHYSQIYQQYRLKRLTVQWVPRIGYNYKGNLAFNFMLGIDVEGVSDPVGYQQISERSLKEIKSVNSPFSLTFRGDNEWRFTGLPDSGSLDSMRSFVECTFGIYVWNCETAAEALGFPVFDFELEFRSNSEAPWSVQSKISQIVSNAYIKSCPSIEYRSYLKGLWYLFRILRVKDEDDARGIDYSVMYEVLEDDPEFIEWFRSYAKSPTQRSCELATDTFKSLLDSYEFLKEKDLHCYDVYNFAEDLELRDYTISVLSDCASQVFGSCLAIAAEIVLSYQTSYDHKKIDPKSLAKSSLQLVTRLILANLENIYMKYYFGDYISMTRDKIKQLEVRSGFLNDSFKLMVGMKQTEILNAISLKLEKFIFRLNGLDDTWIVTPTPMDNN